jgi:hypothetical protein
MDAEETIKPFKWVIEIEVDKVWVADGFDITENSFIAELLLKHWLTHAYGYEVKSKILSSPGKRRIKKMQGY